MSSTWNMAAVEASCLFFLFFNFGSPGRVWLKLLPCSSSSPPRWVWPRSGPPRSQCVCPPETHARSALTGGVRRRRRASEASWQHGCRPWWWRCCWRSWSAGIPSRSWWDKPPSDRSPSHSPPWAPPRSRPACPSRTDPRSCGSWWPCGWRRRRRRFI